MLIPSLKISVIMISVVIELQVMDFTHIKSMKFWLYMDFRFFISKSYLFFFFLFGMKKGNINQKD